MFSSGQIKFGIVFAICFLVAIIYMYRKDLKIHKFYYKGTIWVVVAFLSFIGILFVLKTFIKN